jgi:heme-degrading monooxygenase HmoA
MANVGEPYTSGRWAVKPGQERAFIDRWTEFTQWSLESAPGAKHFALIQDANEPSRFLSFGGWADGEAVERWRSAPDFSERLGRCRELCDEFEARDYTLASEVGLAPDE